MTMGTTKERIRIGILGLGFAGTFFIPNIQKHPHFELTAVSTRNPERLKKIADDLGVETYPEAADFLGSPSIDAVYIATPTELHTEHVLMAAAAGKHIIVEKPLSITLEDADRMIEAAEQNGVCLIVGHSHSFEPPIQKMREIVESGRLGRVRMIHNWYFTDWLYRPRTPEELDTALGGGVAYRQGAHQFDIVRLIGGGVVRSVRAAAGIWDETRPTQGSHTAFLEFDDGTAATCVYNGYDHFHSSELTFGIGEGGQLRAADEYGKARKTIKSFRSPSEEAALKQNSGYGGKRAGALAKAKSCQPFFGLTIVCCEKGDMRQSPEGLYVYGEDEKLELKVSKEFTGRDAVLTELYKAVAQGKPAVHDGRWAKANLEVCMAVLESSRLRKEIYLSHQVPVNR